MKNKIILNNTSAFTLIELLVVVALLGILSGGILIALNITGTIGKASLTKAKKFAAQLENGLAVNQVGKWSFESESSGITPDTSGYGNGGTLSSPSPTWLDSNQCDLGLGRCYSFNGTSNYVSPLNSSTLNADRTFSAWIKPEVGTDPMTIMEEGAAGAAQMYYIYASSPNTGRLAVDSWNRGWYLSSPSVTIGSWNHIAFVYFALTKKVKFYINGVYDIETPAYTNPGFYNTDDIYIGGDPLGSSGNYYKGYIDEVQIYNQALTLSQIGELYAQGVVRKASTFRF